MPGTITGFGDATVKKKQDVWHFGGYNIIRILKIIYKLMIVAKDKHHNKKKRERTE